ncbi:MAG: acyl carrier protein [Desulfuromonadales bacterium]|nr:acyl carrier protein [Desulfuromonadales bacterium]
MAYATNKIRTFIIDNFLFGDDTRLQETTSFLEEGIIDSTGVLELVNFLEEEFGLIITDEELIPENLDSIERVEAFLERKRHHADLENEGPAVLRIGA